MYFLGPLCIRWPSMGTGQDQKKLATWPEALALSSDLKLRASPFERPIRNACSLCGGLDNGDVDTALGKLSQQKFHRLIQCAPFFGMTTERGDRLVGRRLDGFVLPQDVAGPNFRIGSVVDTDHLGAETEGQPLGFDGKVVLQVQEQPPILNHPDLR
jgi:hypothetical protein